MGDTWLYDYAMNEWTAVNSVISPSSRQCGAMVYDPVLGGAVLYSGIKEDRSSFNDTWLFDAHAGEWSLLEGGGSELDEAKSHNMIPGYTIVSVILSLVLFTASIARLRRHYRLM